VGPAFAARRSTNRAAAIGNSISQLQKIQAGISIRTQSARNSSVGYAPPRIEEAYMQAGAGSRLRRVNTATARANRNRPSNDIMAAANNPARNAISAACWKFPLNLFNTKTKQYISATATTTVVSENARNENQKYVRRNPATIAITADGSSSAVHMYTGIVLNRHIGSNCNSVDALVADCKFRRFGHSQER